MNNIEEIVTMGRLLFDNKLWKIMTKNASPEVVHGQSHLEKSNIDIPALESKFNNACKVYFESVADKDKAFRELCDEISLPFYDYMTQEQRANAIKMVEEILQNTNKANSNGNRKMTKEFPSVKEMCDFVLEQSSKKEECAYEIGMNEDGETCLYEKVLVGKVVKNGEE